MIKLTEDAKFLQGVAAGSYGAATTNGTGIDRLGYDDAVVLLDSKLNQATGTLNVKIQDSADNSSFTDVSGAAFVEVTTSNDVALYIMKLNLRPLRRYIRVVAVTAVAACEFGVDVILYNYTGSRPITQGTTVVSA